MRTITHQESDEIRQRRAYGKVAKPSAQSTGSVVLTCQRFVAAKMDRCGRWEDYEIEVRVMAVAEGWAMVRRKGCAPFVAEAKRLKPPNNDYTTGKA